MNRIFVAVVALFVSVASYAQDNQKLGYADTDYILSQLPDAKKVESDLKNFGDQLQAQMKAKAADLEKKVADYEKNYNTLIDAVRRDKESELQQLQAALQKFQQDAQTSFQKKQQDLMSPLYEKVGNAIADVSKENGYSFIITLNAAGDGGNVLLYKDPQFDVSPLVLKKLGVTPTATPATPTK